MVDPSVVQLPSVAGAAAHERPSRYNRFAWGLGLLVFVCIAVSALAVQAWMNREWLLLAAAVALAVIWFCRSGSEALMGLRPGNWIALLLLASLAIRVAIVLIFPYRPAADFHVYHDAGVTMADHWTLGTDAGGHGDSLRCFFPPGQVFTLGVLYSLFGKSVLAAQLFNCVLAALTVLGVYLVARRLWGEQAGRLAGLLAALLPSTVFGCILLGAEVPETFWLVWALWAYLKWAESGYQWRGAILCGVLLGVGALVRPTYLLLPVAFGVHMLLAWPSKGRALAMAVVMGLSLAVVVAPWTWRNYKVTGGLVVISSNGGGNLWSGNNDDTKYGLYTAKTWDWLFKNSKNDLELQQKGMAKAKEWIAAHPWKFAELSIMKFWVMWSLDKDMAWWALTQPFDEADKNPSYPAPSHPRMSGLVSEIVSNGFYLGCVLAAIFGMIRRRKELWRQRGWQVLVACFVCFSLIHMVFESQGKYHYMLVPLLCVFATLMAREENSRHQAPNSR